VKRYGGLNWAALARWAEGKGDGRKQAKTWRGLTKLPKRVAGPSVSIGF
jgi:hypothetical protein